MKLPQNVYDAILSYWSYVKTLKERDHLHTHWFIMNEMSCCSSVRRELFLSSWRKVLPEWYDAYTAKQQCNHEMILCKPVLSSRRCKISHVRSMSGAMLTFGRPM